MLVHTSLRELNSHRSACFMCGSVSSMHHCGRALGGCRFHATNHPSLPVLFRSLALASEPGTCFLLCTSLVVKG